MKKTICWALLLLTTPSISLAGGFHKTVDENGNVSYSNDGPTPEKQLQNQQRLERNSEIAMQQEQEAREEKRQIEYQQNLMRQQAIEEERMRSFYAQQQAQTVVTSKPGCPPKPASSIGDMLRYNRERRECASPQERQEMSNRATRSQLQRIENMQREIQNTQREIGY